MISPVKIRTQQRTAVSTAWLFPYAHTWPNDVPLVTTPSANYTVKDYEHFFKDIGFEDGWAMRQDTEPLVQALQAPGVAVYCLYGTGIATPQAYHYNTFPDADPEVVNGEGDGTVNVLSAVQCKRWQTEQKQPVTLMELPGNEHVAMLLNFTTVAYIKDVLFSP